MKKIDIDKTYVLLNIACILLMCLISIIYYTVASYGITFLDDYLLNYKVYYLLIPINTIYFIYKRNYKFKVYDYFILAYVLFCIISTFTSVSVYESLFGTKGRYESLFVILNYVLMYFNFKNIDNKYYPLILNGFISIILLNVIYSFFEVFTNFSFVKYGTYFSRMAYGTIGNPNTFSSLCLLGVLLGMGLYLFSNKYKFKSLLLLVSSYIGLLLAESSGPFFTVCLVTLLLIIFIIIKKVKIWDKMLTVLLLILLLFPTVLHGSVYIINNNYNKKFRSSINSDVNSIVYNFYNILTKKQVGEPIDSKDNTIKYDYVYGDKGVLYIYVTGNGSTSDITSGRMQIWQGVNMLIKKRPLFGYGIETLYIRIFRLNSDKLELCNKAHNNYLEIWYSSGIFALLAYFAWIVLLTIKGLKSNNKVTWILLFAFIGYGIQIAMNISTILVAPIYYIIAGLLASSLEREKHGKTTK